MSVLIKAETNKIMTKAEIRQFIKEIETKLANVTSTVTVAPAAAAAAVAVATVVVNKDSTNHTGNAMPVHGTHDFVKCTSCKGTFNPKCNIICSLSKEFHLNSNTPKCNITYPHDFNTCPNKLICSLCGKGGHYRIECADNLRNYCQCGRRCGKHDAVCHTCRVHRYAAAATAVVCQLCGGVGHTAIGCNHYTPHDTVVCQMCGIAGHTAVVCDSRPPCCTPTCEIQSHVSEYENENQFEMSSSMTNDVADQIMSFATVSMRVSPLTQLSPPRPPRYMHDAYRGTIALSPKTKSTTN
jgi:hypothetical protein